MHVILDVMKALVTTYWYPTILWRTNNFFPPMLFRCVSLWKIPAAILTTCIWNSSGTSHISPLWPNLGRAVGSNLSWLRRWCAGKRRFFRQKWRRRGDLDWAKRRGSSDRAKSQIFTQSCRRSVSLPCLIRLSVTYKTLKYRHAPYQHSLAEKIQFSPESDI